MADKTKSQITVGSLCWYRDQDGSAKKVQVVEVDRSIIPPKYWVVVDGRKRESEGIRLTLIQPPAQKQPPSHGSSCRNGSSSSSSHLNSHLRVAHTGQR